MSSAKSFFENTNVDNLVQIEVSKLNANIYPHTLLTYIQFI